MCGRGRSRRGGWLRSSAPTPPAATRRWPEPGRSSRRPNGYVRSTRSSSSEARWRPWDRLTGVDFDLTPEQEEFRKAVRRFAEDVIAPRAEEMDRSEELPMDVVEQMAELGLFGLPFPEEHGGQGADFLTLVLAIEELARVDSSIAITLEAAVGLGANPIHTFGTEEQKRRGGGPQGPGGVPRGV